MCFGPVKIGYYLVHSGTISLNLVPLVSQTTTSAQLWDKIHQTYALLSRSHIKQLKDKFNWIVKGNTSIIDFTQTLKACVDQLVVLGKPIEHEDLIDKVLAGLDDSYQSVIETVNARDTTISFEELHEKLINGVVNKDMWLHIALYLIKSFPMLLLLLKTSNHHQTATHKNLRQTL